MKIHITNLYNFNKEDALVKKQHRFAEAGRSLGFIEMGVFSYSVETDTDRELSKRLDGVIAALEPEDVVFIQLPTENGYKYEQRLLNKCKAYKNTRIVLILHDMQMLSEGIEKEIQDSYLSLYKMADVLITPSYCDSERIKQYGLSKILYYNDISLSEIPPVSVTEGYVALQKNDFYIKKVLMDAVESAFMEQNELMQEANRESEDEIQIGFGLHDKTGNYSVWVGTAMQSIVEHTSAPICFHILHDSTLNEQNRNKLIQVATQSRNRIRFHLLDEKLFQDVSDQVSYFTIGTMFRIMLPELLPELSKIIYLDADILVNRDMKELWEIDIYDYYMAAVPDMGTVRGEAVPIPVKYKEVAAERYFNAGVLYINLDHIREKGNMRKEVLAYLQRNKESRLPDQDALNAIYNEKTLLLDESWNCFAQLVYRNGERKLDNRIYHYAGTSCRLYSLAEMDRLYYETISRTPWGTEECRRQLDKALGRTVDRIEQLEKLLHLISGSGKKYIFYGAETFAMRNLYQLLGTKEGDYRVLTNPAVESNCILPCKALSVLTEEKKETFIIFVLPEADDGNAIKNLENIGFINGKDFFVIPRLLPPQQGGYL